MLEEIKIPDIGENVESGKVVAVHIKAGDMVAKDDTVIELETDKALVEIPSPLAGRVIKVLAREGDEMKVGDVIAQVETEQRKTAQEKPAVPSVPAEAQVPVAADVAAAVDSAVPGPEPLKPTPKPASAEPPSQAAPVPAAPSIRRLARELGVPIADVTASGPGGRITEDDIKAYVKAGREGVASIGNVPEGPFEAPPLPDFTRWGKVETIDLSTVRRLTAQSTAVSWRTVPHVTQFDEADISDLDAFIHKNAQKVAQAGGKLTLSAILTKVCALGLKKFPQFNASIDLAHKRLILKKYIHIAMAVDTPRGLLLPVIRDADLKSITQLAVEIVDLAQRARSKKIKRDELEGGSFSISNQGGIGGKGFTPIVLWPQAAILGVSRASRQPRYLQDHFEPRNLLPLSLSYDHRIIDGADAARFLRWICESLEQPLNLHLE